jgi:predicted nuclease of predicted toxin-antitoxin system
MRLSLDENLPSKLTGLFAPEVEAVRVAQQAWRGKENGELIGLAQLEFDALLTMDRNIPHQQNLANVDLVVLILEAALSKARPGKVIRVTAQ